MPISTSLAVSRLLCRDIRRGQRWHGRSRTCHPITAVGARLGRDGRSSAKTMAPSSSSTAACACAARRYVRQSDDGPVAVVPKEVTGLPWGFYTAHGDAGSCDADDERIDRYYLNPRGDVRPAVLAVVTGRMNRRGLPFRFKVLNDSATNRCDGAVLYVDSDLRREVRPVLAEIATSLGNGLAPRVPALTKALAPGIGFAEDPPGDVSFGTHRCALLAEALLAPESRAGNRARHAGRSRTTSLARGFLSNDHTSTRQAIATMTRPPFRERVHRDRPGHRA